MIQVQKLHKYYNKGKSNEIHVINDTTLSLPDKGLVCILGESGSGKTTLLNTLGGLDDYMSGELTVAGETLKGYSSNKMDRIRTEHCGYVFQNYYLLSEHTVDYNIRLVLNMYDMTEEEKTERIDYVLEAVDMLKYKKRQISQLSGGQQQRVAIARALAKTPKIIFADEPTGNLDEANTMRVMHILKKVSESCLVVMVTHETRLADVFANRIIRVDNGKVISDDKSSQCGDYQYEDDSTIYLKEYQCDTSTDGVISLAQYHKVEENTVGEVVEDTPPLTLRVIRENGRYYIEALSDAPVTFVLPNSKKQILDAERPIITQESEEEFNYDLENLVCKRMPRLSLKEIFRVALRNLSLLGKQQLFLVVSFVAMAILFVLTVSDILTLSTIDIRSVVHADERQLIIEVEKNDGFDWKTFKTYFGDLVDDYLETSDIENIQFQYDSTLYMEYSGFEQIEDIDAMLTGYAFTSLTELSEAQLIAGRMPEKANEIVIDSWVLENFIKKEPSLSQILPNPEDYIGKEISILKKSLKLEIVGVCDTGRPNIYIDNCMRMSVTSHVQSKVGGFEFLQQRFPQNYSEMEIGADEMLVSDTFMQYLENLGYSTESFSFSSALNYQIAGTYSEDIGADIVLSKAGYQKLLLHFVKETGRFIINTDDKQTVFNYFDNLPESVTNNLQIFIHDPYNDQYNAYKEAVSVKVDARLIVTITIFAVSLLLLYFSMKSNAMKKIEDIMVYRLLGIQKSSILLIFAVESMLLTCYTSLPTVVLVSGALKFMVSIPSLEMNLVYPWSAVVGIIVFLFIINIVTGVLPIIRLVRKPPAQLTH